MLCVGLCYILRLALKHWWCWSVETLIAGQVQFSSHTHTHTFLMLVAYCFMAIFSTVLSKPKKDLMSRLADCSKHVQSSFSG